MRTGSHFPAVAVGAFLTTAVVLLVGVSMFVEGPAPSKASRGDVGTAVEPTGASSLPRGH